MTDAAPSKNAPAPFIGIRGDMGAGKDTLAELIRAAHPGYSVWKFATGLRECAAIVIDTDPGKLVSAADKAFDLSTTRVSSETLLRRIATAIGHAVGSAGSWRDPLCVRIAEKMFRVLTGRAYGALEQDEPVALPMTVGRFLQVFGTECVRDMVGENVWVDFLFRRWEAFGRPPVIVADTRFPNESAAIREYGGVVVLVRRDVGGRADGRSTRHASERALDDEQPDYTLSNNATIPDLGSLFESVWPALLKVAAARGQ